MTLFTEILLIAYLAGWTADRIFRGSKRDATDQQPKGKRSGLMIRTDYQTGVQYVEGAFGGLTVRVDRDGKPITVPVEEQKA